MTTARQTRYELPRTPAAVPREPPLTLTDEHALLLGQVAIRADDVLAVTAQDRWPGRELRALLGYVRAEVLRQAADEETLLFPAQDSSPGITRLARDHARLRAGSDMLARVAAGESTWSPAQLAATTRDFLQQFERHLDAEESLLTSGTPGKVPATTLLGGHPHEWYPLTEGPVIELDALPVDQAVDAAVHRLLRLRRGERVELRSRTDPHLVWRQLDELSPGGYGFVYLPGGPDRWRVQITRRPAA